MKERLARMMKCVWQAWYPLLIYLCMIDMVSLAAIMGGADFLAGQELLCTMIAAVITAILLLGSYRKMSTVLVYRRISSGVYSYNRRKAAGFVILVGITACLLFNYMFMLLGFTSAAYQQAQAKLFDPDRTIQFAAIGILIPFTEELVFRGFGFLRMRSVCTFTQAAIFSSLCFGLFHGNMVQGIYGACLGFILALVFEVYHGLWAPVLLHMTANINALLLAWLVPGEGAKAGLLPALAVVLLSGLLMLLGIYKIREDRNI